MAVASRAKETPKSDDTESEAGAPRKIPGNLPYLPGSGTLRRVLAGLIEAERPDKFNYDFLENVLKVSGGAARATIPILKRLGFVGVDGKPTDLYARFKTTSGRGPAALQALRTGFPEIFKRSEYAHTVPDAKLRDIIIEITGLAPTNRIVGFIRGTFDTVKAYVGPGSDKLDEPAQPPANPAVSDQPKALASPSGIALAYNINVVLPETSDITVLNAIFRSIKENLLK